MLHSQFYNHHHHFLFSVPISLKQKPTRTLQIVSAIPQLAETSSTLITQVSQFNGGGGATVELPFAATPFLLTAINDPSSVVQVASSVLVTGATAAFFFRSVLRRVKRAKELRFRSSGVNKSLNSLKAMQAKSIKVKAKTTPDQALLGAIIACVVAVGLYKMTTSIETALNHQSISDNFSVRQITITIRTMINGLCYLATFIYGFNSLGLFLYSGQLVINNFMEYSNNGNKIEETKVSESNSSNESLTSNDNTMKEDHQSPNKSQ